MALAILELLASEKANVRFKIDTGTNRYYRLKIGRGVRRKNGIDWVDDIFFSTPVGTNDAAGDLLNSSKDISIPATSFDKGNAYVQLFSFKNAEGKSPAFSRVVKVPMGSGFLAEPPADFALPFSDPASMNMTDSFQPPRRIPCRSYAETYSQQASLEDLLAGIVKNAAPMVLDLLGGAKNAPPGPAGSPAGSNGSAGQADILARLLKMILGSMPGPAGQPTSGQQSLHTTAIYDNRFLDMQSAQFSRPFFLPALVALAPLIGSAIQTLPQLMNAANQGRLQMEQADNKLITDILSNENQRMFLEQLLQAQRQAPSGSPPGNAADLNQLIQLLQQVPAAPQQPRAEATPQPSAAPASSPQSLSKDFEYSPTLSSKAVLSFVTVDPVPWNGTRKMLFAKNQGLQLKIKLNVAEPVPKTSLPKAILRIVFKDSSDQSVRYEKTFKQRDVQPNSAMAFSFLPDELSKLPINKPIAVCAEMRWLSPKTKREYKALGSSEIILVNKYFLKEQGKEVSTERELTDMKQFRPFWNKVWEAPPLDAAGIKRDGGKKYLWELDINTKYSVLLSADHLANGLMETKILRGPVDEESLSERTEGRMKAGIELSIAELNKLVPLWNGAPALDRDKLEAFNTNTFAKNNAGELIYHFKLKGRAGERGMIWVVPIFKLFEFTLNTVQKTDEAGQVVTVGEEKVRFPLPVSARVLGLKSQQ